MDKVGFIIPIVNVSRKCMIKVLEHGVMKVTCPNCKAKLQYEQEDIYIEKRPGGLQYIICPDCNNRITIKKSINLDNDFDDIRL